MEQRVDLGKQLKSRWLEIQCNSSSEEALGDFTNNQALEMAHLPRTVPAVTKNERVSLFYPIIFAFFHADEDGVGPAGEANQAGEDDLDAKAVQAGENLDQFLSSTAKEASATIADPLTAFSSENKELKVEILRLGQDLNQAQGVVDALRMERDELKRQLEMSQQPRPLPLSAAASMGALSIQGSPIHQRMASSRVSSPVVVEEGPVCKVAERVRIRRLDGRDKLLTGSQIASFGVRYLSVFFFPFFYYYSVCKFR